MCYSPTLIKNPNYGKKGGFSFMKDCVSQYIPVPCGHCAECVRLRSTGVLQRVQLEAQFGWPFFCTLTYNDDSMPWHTCSDGVRIRYADVSHVQNMIKRLRAHNAFGRRFRYFGVSELGSQKGRPHFHLIFFVERLPEDNVHTPSTLEPILFESVLHEWRKNVAIRYTKRGRLVPDNNNPKWIPLCTFIQKFIFGKLHSTYDLHYIQPSPLDGSDGDVSMYVTKYLFKHSDKRNALYSGLKLNLDPDEFHEVWNKVKPRSFSSLNFGFGYYGDLNPRKTKYVDRIKMLGDLPSSQYVRESIQRSKVSQDRPKFFDLQTGTPLPLSRYWYRFGNVFTIDDALTFFYESDARADNVFFDERDATSKLLAESKYLRVLDSDPDDNYLDLLFENGN